MRMQTGWLGRQDSNLGSRDTDTGRLAGSIFAEFLNGGLRAIVGTDVVYGEHLELGTKNIAARPWLFPAFERNKDKIKDRVRKAVKAAGRKAGRK